MYMTSGVYKITNIINKKVYIGSSCNAKQRLTYHKKLLKNDKGQTILQKAWNKYGEVNFKFEIMLYCSKDDLLFYEQRAINVFKAASVNGYNICAIAGNTLGRKNSESIKEKMSNNRRGKPAWNKGKKMPACVGIKIAKANRSRIWKEETKRKMSVAHIGKKLSIHHSNKISESLIGHAVTEEIKKKMSEAHKGKTLSKETKIKISKSLKERRCVNG